MDPHQTPHRSRRRPRMSDSHKRKHGDEEELLQGTSVVTEQASSNQQMVVKKQRTEEEERAAAAQAQQQQLVAVNAASSQLIVGGANQAPPRTSSLQAATMQLTGHAAAVYAVRFSPSGRQMVSAGGDKLAFLWDMAAEDGTPTGTCINSKLFTGHDGPILDLAWTPGADQIVTASTDKTAAQWDVESGARIKRMRGHAGIVNAVGAARRGQPAFVTAGDDCSVLVWDPRSKHAVHTIKESYQVLSTSFSDDGSQVFSAGISNDVKCYDLRTGRMVFDLIGHRDSVTGMALSPDGSFLLTNGMDNTLRCWDVRPFVAGAGSSASAAASAGASAAVIAGANRQTQLFKGHTHDLEQNLLRCAWSPDGLRVTGGSADKTVNVWEAATGRILYRLPGHKGSVNDVAFHPFEPIIASASSDKTIFIGEL